ncbi:hypothetical protein T4A_4070 [Trichinella pseudospiralis]|uniref:Uncharacterized protein n=1 Tax=Trichinella pseudospiralis TaxID=6337 RepID=A0A0V1DRD4_TRIPS|nr:hypothetical protein T4A_4070 [Trichinella pseudospiralis]
MLVFSRYLETYATRDSQNSLICDLLVLRKWRKTCFQNLDLF